MGEEGDLVERLRQLPAGSAVALKLDPLNYADSYLHALNAIVHGVGTEPNSHTIYVSVTNPSALVWTVAQALDVQEGRLSFVDAISHIMMDFRSPLPNASYIESPRMLENIMLRVEYLLRTHPRDRCIVVIDSVNSLAIHNTPSLLSEFFHILINNLRARHVLTILLAATEEATTYLDQILALVVDESLEVRPGTPGQ
jgi:KaiC/GvpD/RAD55 family RecA-like ATPase